MKTTDFDFDLPPFSIAHFPVMPRDAARLLHVPANDYSLHNYHMRDLPSLLQPGDCLVCNDTRVIPARLTGMRGEAKVEVTLHQPIAPDSWRAFAKPAKRLRLGDHYQIAPDFWAEVSEKGEEGEVGLRFNVSGEALWAALERYGAMPLPPYIQRDAAARAKAHDEEDYQTVYARHKGAVAAPTAGLHFTPELLTTLAAKGIKQTFVTLHVGAGTFLPVKADYVQDHKMHAEYGIITAETAATINATRQAGGRIIAVGTTSLRLLESAADEAGLIHPFQTFTQIFITPGYRFKSADLLLTNFHLPKSTLFMLVSAFAGLERMQTAYHYAIESGYRFYSYGDACLLERSI